MCRSAFPLQQWICYTSGMKKSLALLILSAAALVSAAPVPCTFDAWEANPLATRFSGDAIAVRGRGTLAPVVAAPHAANVTVSARVTPTDGGTNGWATLGVAIVDDVHNYWHLALVQQPPDLGGGHYFEISEMRQGEWLSHHVDKLRCEYRRQSGRWENGKTYQLTLTMDAQGIQGAIRDAAGREVFATRYAFPAAAADGSVRAVTRGRPAIHANGGFLGSFAAVDAAWSSPCTPPPAEKVSYPPYASDSFAPDVKDDATGFFRVKQMPDGRWWVIDPLGRGMVLMGVDHVTYHGHWSQRTKRSVHHEVNKQKFPDKKDWEADTLNRLKSWGFNLLGAGCDAALQRRGLVHTIFLSIGDSLCWDENDDEFWICPNEHRPCSAFPNVFHPLFPAHCDYVARTRCARQKDDPWLFGYFIDNELAWWGRGARDTGLFDAVMKKPETHTAKIALRAFLKERSVTGEPSAAVKLDFLRLAAEKYFACSAAAIRKYDPHHLVMGARFAGLGGAHDAVWEVAGKHCDLVTFNIYPWADLDRNVVLTDRGRNAQRVIDAFAARYAIVKRPMLITEWSFPALDSGLPCTGGAGQRFHTQKQRTAATELFAKTMLATPSLLGYDYFMWVDEPAEGISDAFPEDSNYGLINLQGEAYPDITRMFTALQKNVGHWRRAGLPAERPAPPTSGLTAPEFLAHLGAVAEGKGVTFTRTGDVYTLANRAGLVLTGKIGNGRVFRTVTLNGKTLGEYTVMVNYDNGGFRWQDMTKVTDVAFEEREGRGILTVTGEWKGGTLGCRITQTVMVLPDRPWFLANITKAVNIGTDPLDVRAFYFRQYSPFALEKKTGLKSVPNLWKAPLHDAWFRASDGAWWGGMTMAPTATMLQYFLSNEGKHQHPDASFAPGGIAPVGSPEGLFRIVPGASYEPHDSMWMLCLGGFGGSDAWQKAVESVEIK